ncbi:hypothetical protein EG68_12344 [Paragonimus skrjabini miyazakii]|uniref:EGF-like domain-containing protein n=1 Tax=Paragonimus skrjabini miyazakii TaxID=59628 RepID=A0A8S9YMX7_9TREM|nr:hypothetical protein EG68_12344 [Paragonimus skrjabini miyazakii]
MRKYHAILLNLLLALSWLNLLNAEYVKEIDVFVTTPSTLFVEHANTILVRTKRPTSVVKLTTSIQYGSSVLFEDAVDHKMYKLPDSWYGTDIQYRPSFVPVTETQIKIILNFSVALCTDYPACINADNTRHLSQTVDVARRNAIVLGETDKPIYRPGEIVRMRFLALKPQFTVPLNEPVTYPPRKPIITLDGNLSFVELTPADVDMLNGIAYEEISLVDSRDNRVKQWLRASPRLAANLSYQLLDDAPEGEWQARVHFSGKTEVLRFSVKHYVLPRFLIIIQPPNNLTFETKFAQFSVCAKYTTGQPMLGSVRAQLCVCEKSFGEKITLDERTLITEENVCPKNLVSFKPRPCIRLSELLRADGCAFFNTTTRSLELDNTDFPHWGKGLVCAEVEEEGTQSTVTRCEFGASVTRKKASIELTVPSVFKPGLPIMGSIALRGIEPIHLARSAVLTVKVTEERLFCWYPRSSLKDTYKFITFVKTDSNGLAQFSIPPINSARRIFVKATYVPGGPNNTFKEANHDSKTRSFLPFSSRTKEIEAYNFIRPWLSQGGSSLQLWPTNKPVVAKCPGAVTVNMLANTQLAKRAFYVQCTVRGRLLQRYIPAQLTGASELCRDRDDALGHYTCESVNSDRIVCLPGWTGDDCLQPVCAKGCHPRGGVCHQPNTCSCTDGCTGVNCQDCVKRTDCKHGRCVNGDDCVCDPGWMGFSCDTRMVNFLKTVNADSKTAETNESHKQIHGGLEESGESTKAVFPRRTLYERQITFSIDGDWGPEATVVVYFYKDDDDSEGVEVVPMVIELRNLDNCTNPATAMQAESVVSGIQFDRYHVSPGQEIQLSVRPADQTFTPVTSVITESEKIPDQVCFLRMSDISLDNFEQEKNLVDMASYINRIQHNQETIKWRSAVPDNVLETFRSAGLQLTTLTDIGIVRQTFQPCLARMYSTVVDGPMGLALSPLPMSAISSNAVTEENQLDSVPIQTMPRLRHFFPEVWLFDYAAVKQQPVQHGRSAYGVQTNLTVPDSITTWRASAFCTTKSNGLWIPPSKQLTVSMPFFIEITLPKQVIRGEILYLPISVHVIDDKIKLTEIDASKECFDIRVFTQVDEQDWVRVSISEFTGCACQGEKRTFQIGLLARRLGQLNVTVIAQATSGSVMCYSDTDDMLFEVKQEKHHMLQDMVRRSVRVVPEGVSQAVTIGDIICLRASEVNRTQTFPLVIPKNVIPGSLRVYWSYTDEVLGPALKNLNSLVQMPTGCGEQNMVLVAPNVYVLDYLKSSPSVNVRQTEKLIRDARTYIETGYHGQSKYRHEDGSYSAFGKSDGEGSTWLTAFVLRVFSKAYKVDSSVRIEWTTLFNETVAYLTQRQDSLGAGCFIEKGRVIHSAIQGGLSTETSVSKESLLTAYVLTALWGIGPILGRTLSSRLTTSVNDGLRCLTEAINPGSIISQMSTYELAQFAYTFSLIEPQSSNAVALLKELLNRRHTESSAGLTDAKNFWSARSNLSTKYARLAEAIDIETTSYAYLALAQSGLSISELFPVIRWLASHQNANGGFRSTQDTVLGLEAIADGAKRLGLDTVNITVNQLEVEAILEPMNYSIRDKVTSEKRRVVNQFAVPYMEPLQAQSSRWDISATLNSSRQCLAVQTILYYNVPDTDATDQAAFDLSISVAQPRAPPSKACTSAVVTICLRVSEQVSTQRDSGMLLIKVLMVSGWQPIEKEVFGLVGTGPRDSELVRMVEISDDGTLWLYFDGFTASEATTVGVYVENTRSAMVTAMDYYATERSVSRNYSLDECTSGWNKDTHVIRSRNLTSTYPSVDGTTELTAEQPSVCPTCEMTDDGNGSIVDELMTALCNGYNYIYVLQIHGGSDAAYNVTVSAVMKSNYTASWNATLHLTTDSVPCNCQSIKVGSQLLMFSPNGLDIYLGQPDLSIRSKHQNVLLLPASDLFPSIRLAFDRWLSNSVMHRETGASDETTLKTGTCSQIRTIYLFIQTKLL